MTRRELMLFLLTAAIVPPSAVRAERRRTPLIGVLAEVGVIGSAFQDGLREAGFVEGRNITIERHYLGGRYDLLPATAAELVRRRVDLLAAVGHSSALAAKRATATIPIVFQSWDPVPEGLVKSLARPGGNLTGVSLMDSELMPKRLELLLELGPRGKKIGLLVNPRGATAAAVIRNTQRAAHTKGVELHVVKASTDAEVYAAFNVLERLHAGGLIVDLDAFFNRVAGTLAALDSIPAVYGWRGIAEVGGLLSYGPSLAASHRRMGLYAGRILKGAKPADLPVVEIDTFELVINMKTARALGLKIPPSVLALADEIIG